MESYNKMQEERSYSVLSDKNFPGTQEERGWSGGAMVLGKLPVPGRPTCLD